MVMSQTAAETTLRVPRLHAGRQRDWRFAILGLEPTTDQEFIERAYFHQLQRYTRLSATDPEATQRLALLKEAYQSLCPAAEEPWTTRQVVVTASARRAHEQSLLDIVLVVFLLLCLLGATMIAIDDGTRMQVSLLLQHLGLMLQHLFGR